MDDNSEAPMAENSDFELTDGYKLMIDTMLDQEENGEAQYVSLESIKNKSFPYQV